MSTVDVYRITNQLDDDTLDVLVTRLEARGSHPRFAEMMHEYFDAMSIDSAKRVLDLGCGSGVAARAIARRPGFSGHVMGIDRSPHLVSAAKRISTEEGLESEVEYHSGDSHSLKLADGQFDAVVAHTLFSHLDDPRGVLSEIARVVKRGGRVGIFDGDYASVTFAAESPEEAKATDEAIINAIVTNPRVMRQMPELLSDAGFQFLAGFSYVVADMGRADFWESAIQSLIKLLPKSGAMTESEAAEWAAAMARRSEQGTFFGASNYYAFVAEKG